MGILKCTDNATPQHTENCTKSESEPLLDAYSHVGGVKV